MERPDAFSRSKVFGPSRNQRASRPTSTQRLIWINVRVDSIARSRLSAAKKRSLTFPRVDKKNAESLAEALQHAPVA
jgi:hypothetical protein